MNRANVIDLVAKDFKAAKTAIVLTHNIDFLFVESMLLSRLRAIGHPQLTIFADAACASQSYQDQHKLIERLGSQYRVVPIDLGNARRFHPKAFFLCDPDRAVLAVGSGNATHGGWSANQEVWSDFSSDTDGGPALSAFREYLDIILGYVPEAENVRETSAQAFADDTNLWARDLPPPGLIAYTPRSETMIQQITSFAGTGIESIDIVSPYFDPEAAALTHLSTLAKEGVRAYLQPRHAGLSSDLLHRLPGNVRQGTIEDVEEERRHKFIHAKAYVVKTPGESTICIGSANCSRAALMADASWGNAEIMALKRLPTEEIEEMFSGFLLTEGAPELPETHPSEDWEIAQSDLRILAAHHENGQLVIHYKSSKPPARLFITSDVWAGPLETFKTAPTRAFFSINHRCETVRLHAIFNNDHEAVSAPAWIDHEDALRIGSAARSLRGRLETGTNEGGLTGDGFLKILELFDLHVQQPVSRRSKLGRRKDKTEESGQTFTEDDIYAHDFGKPSSISEQSAPHGFRDTDTLALFLSFFQTRDERSSRGTGSPGQSDEDQEDDTQEAQVHGATQQSGEIEKFGKRIERLLSKIELALSKPEFTTNRPPSRLSADISFVALLMVKALQDGFISHEFFHDRTIRIWRVLFLGHEAGTGAIPTHLESLDETERTTFVDEFRDPQLSAAMALWSMMERQTNESNPYFRFAAAQLAAQHPWLAQGGPPDEIVDALDEIAMKLLPAKDDLNLHDCWRVWVQEAHAIDALTSALQGKTQKELAELSPRSNFEAGEIVWQTGHEFCALHLACNRATQKKAELRPIHRTALVKVKSDFVAPIADIIATEINVSDRVKAQLNEMIQMINRSGKTDS